MISPTRRASALIVTILIMGVMALIGLYMFQKIIPVLRNTRGIEDSSEAHYQVRSALETALLTMSGANPSYSATLASNDAATLSGYTVTVIGSGRTIPMPGEGTSDYDRDWSQLNYSTPFQILIDNQNVDWSTVRLHIRSPDLAGTGGPYTLSGGTILLIGWSLIGNGNVAMNGTMTWGNLLNATKINGSETGGIALNTFTGIDSAGHTSTLDEFYKKSWAASAFGLGSCAPTTPCTLKLSVLNPLIIKDGTSTGTTLPYVEVRLTDLNVNLPLQHAVVHAQGSSHGYRMDESRHVLQTTSNTSLGFTIFQ